MKKYIFDREVACEIGVESAIMMENLFFWIEHNKANEVNLHDGTYWTFSSIKAFCEIFPFWTRRTIDRILHNLESNGYIKTGNYNKSRYDRTKWYAFTEKGERLMCTSISPNREIEERESQNGKTEMGKSTIEKIINKDDKHIEDKSADAQEPVGSITPSKSKNKTEIPFPESAEFQTAWQGFVEMRKEKKARLTERAKELIFKKLQKLAPDDALMQAAILDQSTEHNWTGVFPLHNDDNTERKDSYGRSNSKFGVRGSRPGNAEQGEREWTPANNSW